MDAGADCVKLEGAKLDVIRHLSEHFVNVVGHTGLTPQTAKDSKQVGAEEADAERILSEAQSIVSAGAFMLVIEHVPDSLGELITKAVSVPTIGIGAGTSCDGQVLVVNDASGMGDRWPPFSRQYAFVGGRVEEAARSYVEQVTNGTY